MADNLSAAELQELQELEELEQLEQQFAGQDLQSPPPSADPTQAALEGAGQTLTLGYLPRIQAAVEPAQTAILNLLTGQNVETPEYEQRLLENVARQAQQAETQPGATMAGKAAGLAVTAPLLGGAGGMGAAAARGAAMGAAADPGIGRETDITARLSGAAVGGLTGGAGAGLGKLGRGLAARKNVVKSMKGFKLGEQLKARTKDALQRAKDAGHEIPEDVSQVVKRVEKNPITVYRGAKPGRDTAESLKKLDDLAGSELTTLSGQVTSSERALLDPVRYVRPLGAPDEMRRVIFRSMMGGSRGLEAAGSPAAQSAMTRALLEGKRKK